MVQEKGMRQSPTMSADIVTNTDSSMLVTAGGNISQERAGKNVDMDSPRKLNERVFFSVINTCVRTIAGRRERRKRPALTTSFQKLMAVLMTMPIWSRCAGNATEQKQQEIVFDELYPLHILWAEWLFFEFLFAQYEQRSSAQPE